MTIGPIQLIVLGFDNPDFQGEIIAELERLRDNDVVRVMDALAVYKDTDGNVEVAHLNTLTKEDAIELGSTIGALLGLEIEGDRGMVAGAVAGAELGAEAEGIEVFDEDEAWDVIDEIPNGTAAALILLEHRWAISLREAVARTGGYRINDAFISPLDLVDLGLHTVEEAQKIDEMSTGRG
ncbi:hypothetical protein [Pengzhenrongella phosphoraccumulans]|jgi:uncharacterized membrane protein|uniref:hypothetical protein n=1 Tax=Pengzhenrongella phosphoraccumulans TaxID=3114394 RepID=UPI0038901DA4